MRGCNDISLTLMTETEQLIEGSLSWCQNFNYGGSIGNEGNAFMAGASWTADDLSQFTGMYIGKMTFFIAGGSPDVVVYIYADGNLIHQQSILQQKTWLPTVFTV